ncbi:hypothetical protein DQ04_00661150 [Trypanosoma grayi]|uniref:hypothetical protein n=1 Tax=Trypanosoma grayi TaxID=71804 RepID=UPI0004F4B4A4|nr:hypothetical protein DQ04_00661150 [Trypanosoma grayi]KEG14037.1 hypothetical protein DQ04_00661150 [Trypanosoma grayi]
MELLTCTRGEFEVMAEGLARRLVGWRIYRKEDIFGRIITWLEGSSALQRGVGDDHSERLIVTFFLTYSECYCQPQLHFFPERPLSAQELCTLMGECVCSDAEEGGSYEAPIISMTFCEELQMALWGLHQCDTMQLLTAVASEGVKGNLLELFLQAVGQLVGLDEKLLPSCAALATRCPQT